jgi:membrane protease YdiL (CAAX protease family)
LIYNFGISHIFDFSRNSSVVTSTFNELFNFKILALITVLLVSPIYEEIIFRGLILNALRERHSETLSIVISAILFSIVHLNLVQCVNTFLIGLILGLIYVKTESLYIVIFAHIFHNMLALKLPTFINGPNWLQITGSVFIIIISLLVFLKSIAYIFNHKTEIEND